jgi:methylated-DNA-protein-cysteine methyltransferase-like protein
MTNFYAAVYRLVAQIPAGRVTTYGQIARWLGHLSAARAVGYALHVLPAGSEIPWQRVINAAGRVSARCDQHYEAIQRALLEAEGVQFDRSGSVDLKKFGWSGPLAFEHHLRAETHQQAPPQHHEDRHIPPPDVRRQASPRQRP